MKTKIPLFPRVRMSIEKKIFICKHQSFQIAYSNTFCISKSACASIPGVWGRASPTVCDGTGCVESDTWPSSSNQTFSCQFLEGKVVQKTHKQLRRKPELIFSQETPPLPKLIRVMLNQGQTQAPPLSARPGHCQGISAPLPHREHGSPAGD